MLPSNSLPSMRLMRTILFSFSGKFNSQLTATPPRQVSCERGVSLNPLYLIHLSVPQERGVPYAPAACQCPVTGTPLTSPLCQRVAWPFRGTCPQRPCSQLVHYPSSQVCCQALLTPLEDLHSVPAHGIRHLLTNLLVIENCDRLRFSDCCCLPNVKMNLKQCSDEL